MKGLKMKKQVKKEEEHDVGYLPDTRPRRHDGNEPATKEVLNDMALEDALDEFDND